MTATAKKVKTIKAPALTAEDRAAVNRVLDAAGVVLVTRAMTRVCKPKYENGGWHNCFFTQMFGGRANLERLAEAHRFRTGVSSYTYAIAEKLGVDQSDVGDVIDLFDWRTEHFSPGEMFYTSEDDTGKQATVDTYVQGKVVSLLAHINRWLKRRGVNLYADLSAHKTTA